MRVPAGVICSAGAVWEAVARRRRSAADDFGAGHGDRLADVLRDLLCEGVLMVHEEGREVLEGTGALVVSDGGAGLPGGFKRGGAVGDFGRGGR